MAEGRRPLSGGRPQAAPYFFDTFWSVLAGEVREVFLIVFLIVFVIFLGSQTYLVIHGTYKVVGGVTTPV